MRLDNKLLRRFEEGLNPRKPDKSIIKARIVGYGEISTVFQIDNDNTVVYKRLPLFKDMVSAKSYEYLYHEYCGLLERLDILLPENGTAIIAVPGRPIVLYIGQTMLPPERFGHRLIHSQKEECIEQLIKLIIATSEKTWRFCEENRPGIEIALDAQLSNWVFIEDGEAPVLYFIDVSTPFIKKNNHNQLNPDLLLQAAPKPLRKLLKWLYADKMMNRYYDPQKNMTDLAANLFKEQKPELIPLFIDIINHTLPTGVEAVTRKGVESYYKEDKFIWELFLRLRHIDCQITTKLFRQRYEFILPGKIKR